MRQPPIVLLSLMPLLLVALLAACTAGGRQQRLAQLEELERRNLADSLMTDDSLALALADWFDSHGTPNERLRAHYILGRTYADLGEAPAAVNAYQDAADCADTTAADCDWAKLSRVYGQMSVIYHQQNLPKDEIRSINKFLQCQMKAGDTLGCIYYEGNLVRPYYLLGDEDKVLRIVRDVHNRLREAGDSLVHALSLGTAIYIYTKRGELEQARQALDIYEQKSGLLDAQNNIAEGWESYYWVKGFYEFCCGHTDTAEQLYRKAVRFGDEEAASNGYKGLLAVYRRKQDPDSIAHYSLLVEAALDSFHNRMQTDAIRQSAALYDYNRNKKLAEEEGRKNKIQRHWFLATLAGMALLILLSVLAYLKRRKEEAARLQQLEQNLLAARSELRNTQNELEELKAQNLEGLIAEKERRVQELILHIAELEEENRTPEKPALKNCPDDFRQSKIAKVFEKKALSIPEHPLPSKAEWALLVRQFQKDMPAVYHAFSEQKKLSQLELHTCILLFLDFDESTIVRLTQASSQSVSTAKSRANMKLFGEKGAVTLKYNLNRLLSAL